MCRQGCWCPSRKVGFKGHTQQLQLPLAVAFDILFCVAIRVHSKACVPANAAPMPDRPSCLHVYSGVFDGRQDLLSCTCKVRGPGHAAKLVMAVEGYACLANQTGAAGT